MDRQRLAAALAYEEERRRRMRESVPVIDDAAPTTQPRRSLRSDLENLSSGLGQAGVNILEGGKALLTDPIGTVRGTYETVKGVVRDPSVIADALRYTADKAMSGPLGAGEVIGEMVNPIRFRRTPVMQEIDVYHGSPHRFEEFDASKIGTGEGAQSYGHGIYLAESPDVAKSYQKQLAQINPEMTVNFELPISGKSKKFAETALKDSDGNTEAAIELLKYNSQFYSSVEAKNAAREAINALKTAKITWEKDYPIGHFYTADLPDEMVDRMLDWDKPLSEQSESVRKAVQQINAEFAVPYTKLDEPLGFYVGKLGDAVGGHANASKLMASYGVPGIKYMDEGSRGYVVDLFYKGKPYAEHSGVKHQTLQSAQQRIAEAEAEGFEPRLGTRGTRNFVVFPGEEKKVKILRRE